MAIQLSERDNLIFSFVEEHHVLLEKHIAWFISCHEKPVLIRDRLRKLFYLDYLLCERHGGKLPWWTTPTKPLVYMLSPMTRQLVKAVDEAIDLSSPEMQRHLLEVANLRMLLLMDQKDGIVSDLSWTTTFKTNIEKGGPDAVVSFKRNGSEQRIGIVNHPMRSGAELASVLQSAIAENSLDNVWVVCRDEAHMSMLQRSLVSSSISSKLNFTTHQDVYKSGMAKAKWQSTQACIAEPATERLTWTPSLAAAEAY